jgi:predicted bacteriocin transport accessory protein
MISALVVSSSLLATVIPAHYYNFNVIRSEKVESQEISHLIKLDSISGLYTSDFKYIYFGRPTCPDCIRFVPILEKVLQENDMYVYYFNTDFWKSSSEYSQVLSSFNVEYVPTIIKINGDDGFKSFTLDGLAGDISITDFEVYKKTLEFMLDD